MTIHRNVFAVVVESLIDADDDLLSEAARVRFIEAALRKYSGDSPDESVVEVTGDAGQFYPVATNLTGWAEGISQITQIEYPAATVASDETPTILDPEDWQADFWALLSGTNTRYLYLPGHAPAATETMRISYTLPYTFDTSTLQTEVPPQDQYAVCYWAAGLCCQALAAKYAKSNDSTIAVDSATHSPTSADFAARAQEFFALYNQHLGIGEEGAEAIAGVVAGEFVDWDTAPGWPSGREFIFRTKAGR